MNKHQQVIQLAKQNALKKFSILVQRMAQNSDKELVESLSKDVASSNASTLNEARHFLRKEGDEFIKTMEAEFLQKMEREMQALHGIEQSRLDHFTADTMSLIDDQTVNIQIEVGHLVTRLRDTCGENLGRMNIIMAQLLDKTEVREKDNPFRPDLIAQTLHDVLCAMVPNQKVRNFLFTYSTNSLAMVLPEYYAELCEVFKSGGISPQILARPTARNRQQREQYGRPAAGDRRNDPGSYGPSADDSGYGGSGQMPSAIFDQNVLPTLQRLLKLIQLQAAEYSQLHPNAVPAPVADAIQSAAFQGFVSNIFSRSASAASGLDSEQNAGDQEYESGAVMVPADLTQLLARLNEFQQMAAHGRGVDEHVAPLANQLFSVGSQLGEEIAGRPDRTVLDVIAVLFEFILSDDQISDSVRAQIGRLQIPFVKAALLDPGMLQQDDHPSRRLLNHMGMVSVGLPADTAFGQNVTAEIKRIVKKVLEEFDKDATIFTTSLEELKRFMAEELRRADPATASCIDAMEEAEKICYLTDSLATSIREMFLAIAVDKRVADFCLETWARVLVKVAIDAENASTDAFSKAQADQALYLEVMPDLIWSAQDKQTAADRNALVKLLPKLVDTIKRGLSALQFSEEESKRTLDKLVAVHAHVLGSTEAPAAGELPSLEELREMFKGIAIRDDTAMSKATAQPDLDIGVVQASLAQRGITADLEIGAADPNASKVEYEWLSEMHIGTRVEYLADGGYQLGRLVWIGINQSLFMFKLDKSSTPTIYSPVSLSKALRDGVMNFVETAPTFERAVGSLLQGTELMKRKPAPSSRN